MTEKRREMEARLRAEREQQRGRRLGAQKQAEIRAEAKARSKEVSDKAYNAESEASFGWMEARDQKTEQAYLTSAGLYKEAAQAYLAAAEAHQAYADAGGKRAVGEAKRYAGQTPARAANWCRDEAEGYTRYAKEMAAKAKVIAIKLAS